MFHLHIAGSGYDDYWNYHNEGSALMGCWFGQLKRDIRFALLFVHAGLPSKPVNKKGLSTEDLKRQYEEAQSYGKGRKSL